MKPPIPYYGGKTHRASNIVEYFPAHTHYVEVFGGSGAVLFAKPPPPGLEVYNDIDQGLSNLFHVLREPELFQQFERRVHLTLYSRAAIQEARECLATGTADEITRAWAYYVAVRQGFSGKVATKGRAWGLGVSSRQRARVWLSSLDRLPMIHDRLRNVQIECSDFELIIKTYDAPGTLLYCDPPYFSPERRAPGVGYLHDMGEADHRRLVALLLEYPEMVVLSGYQAELYAPLIEAGWQTRFWEVQSCATATTRRASTRGRGGRAGQRRTEVLWLNPAAVAGQPQMTLGLDTQGGG